MGKIVYNTCCGGFSLSDIAHKRAKEITGDPEWGGFQGRYVTRHDPVLIQVIEELGQEANGTYAYLQIKELPAGTKYRIDEYDGAETVLTPEDGEWEVVP